MAKSITEAMANKGIGVRLAAPDQPPAPPKTRVWIEARNIGLDVYHEFSTYLSQLLEDERKPRFFRRKEKPKRIDLQDVLHDIDERVKEAFERELQEVVGQIPPEVLEESLAGFKQTARLEFLRSLLRYWPGSFDSQIFETTPELAPLPEISKETLKTLRELQAQVDKAVEQMEQALQEITKCLDAVAAVAREEHGLLRGTAEQGKERFRPLLDELPFAIKIRIGQWQGKQTGLHEKEKPLQANRRRW
ncbi:MAG: hypothetical protein K6U04_05580 [Armatimonadetes bacterium]|nr:hypothetical protein [Armatimonadota bacterium]